MSEPSWLVLSGKLEGRPTPTTTKLPDTKKY